MTGTRQLDPPGDQVPCDQVPPLARDHDRRIPSHDRRDFAPRRSRYAVVVPVINEGDRLRAQLRRMHDHGHGLDVLIADGGSTDGSLADDFLAANGVRSVLVKRGPGRLSAQLRMAFAAALDDGYHGVVTVDGNGKDGVEAIGRFRDRLDAGYDYVQGSRFVPGGVAVNTPWSRYLGIRLLHAPMLSAGARTWYTDTTNGFRGHSARLLADPRVGVFRDVFDAYELLAYLPVRAARLGLRVCEVPVTRAYPAGAVPTKIKGWSGNLNLLAVAARAATGRYDPAPWRARRGRG
ncbi:glycosyltransferase family 2 protein [Solwaraspora sp. WMMD937]|uniref:glycosyltransferase family 2 protein n=1 Tax=Solwaraspora sp. WMMD937 TaxID=3016090 RepID=UPI002499D831|nr:glycosyltransferase family 2 protein [Solwaraspora sp. WMMD937]WFE19299.1 glycosyltransferase family 2 protein [Solwaraspora sp. WMMD937]